MTTIVRTRTDTIVRTASIPGATVVRSSGAVSPTVIRVTGVAQAGPPGAAAVGAYTHTQASSSAVWTVQHQLGFHPQPTVLDVDGNVVHGWTPTWPTDDVLILTFPVALAGTAYVS